MLIVPYELDLIKINFRDYRPLSSVNIDACASDTLIPFTSKDIIKFDEVVNNDPLVYTYNADKNFNNAFLPIFDINYDQIINRYFLPSQHYLLKDRRNKVLQFLLYRIYTLNNLHKIGEYRTCLKSMSSNSKIIINSDSLKPDITQFSRCGKLYCPLCSNGKIFSQKEQLTTLLDFNEHNSNLFITFTIPNDIKVNLKELYELLQTSFSNLIENNQFNYSLKKFSNKTKNYTSIKSKHQRFSSQSLKELVALKGIYKSFDITFNYDRTGKHPHLHTIFMCGKKLTEKELSLFKQVLTSLWHQIVLTNSNYYRTYTDETIHSLYLKSASFDKVDFMNHAIDIIDSSKDLDKVSRYITNNLNLSNEVINYRGKATKSSNNYNINNLYSMLNFNQYDTISKSQVIATIKDFSSVTHYKHLNSFLKLDPDMSLILSTVKADIKKTRTNYAKNLRIEKQFKKLRQEIYHNKVADIISKYAFNKPVAPIKLTDSTNRHVANKTLLKAVLKPNLKVLFEVNKINDIKKPVTPNITRLEPNLSIKLCNSS